MRAQDRELDRSGRSRARDLGRTMQALAMTRLPGAEAGGPNICLYSCCGGAEIFSALEKSDGAHSPEGQRRGVAVRSTAVAGTSLWGQAWRGCSDHELGADSRVRH